MCKEKDKAEGRCALSFSHTFIHSRSEFKEIKIKFVFCPFEWISILTYLIVQNLTKSVISF